MKLFDEIWLKFEYEVESYVDCSIIETRVSLARHYLWWFFFDLYWDYVYINVFAYFNLTLPYIYIYIYIYIIILFLIIGVVIQYVFHILSDATFVFRWNMTISPLKVFLLIREYFQENVQLVHYQRYVCKHRITASFCHFLLFAILFC